MTVQTPQFKFPRMPAALCRRFLGPNGDLMVVSALVSGLIIWAVHPQAAMMRHERTFPVPVSVVVERTDFAVASIEPATVQITFRGSQDEISTIVPERLSVELVSNVTDRNARKWAPNRDPEQGSNTVERVKPISIRDRDVNGKGKLKIVSVEPSSVDVRYDAMVSWPEAGRRIATPKLVGVPMQGSASVEMPTNLVVAVRGSESKLEAFRDKKILLPTAPVNVEGKTESFDAPVAILIPPDSGITQVDPATITVHVEVTTVAAAGVEEDTTPLIRVAPDSSIAAAPPATDAQPSQTNSSDRASAPADGDSGSGETVTPQPVPEPAGGGARGE